MTQVFLYILRNRNPELLSSKISGFCSFGSVFRTKSAVLHGHPPKIMFIKMPIINTGVTPINLQLQCGPIFSGKMYIIHLKIYNKICVVTLLKYG